MKLTRREALRAGGAAGLLAVSGCAELARELSHAPLPNGWAGDLPAGGQPPAGDLPILRTLNRAGFGARPGDVERVREMGLDAYLEEQLHPERVPETRAIAWRLWQLDTLQADTDFRYEIPKEQAQPELQQAAVVRAVYSRRQLQEVMVDFWTDHFNISQLKGDGAFLKPADDEAVIRKHALGRFHDLLWASATSPAMLHYLDNEQSTNTAPNENYARELMELHTLGVAGGYTQQDVEEVARCFTGWSFSGENAWRRGQFRFDPDRHDDGARRVLGIPLPAGLGRGHGERVLEILAGHPATARFIARKLCRRFVADEGEIPGALVERLARSFRRTNGDLRQMLSVLFRSEEFRRGPTRKLRRPFDFAVASLRALNADTDGRGVLAHLRLMGHLPYQWAMPDGYPENAGAWMTGLLPRWNFAVALLSGQVAGARVDLEGLLRAAGADTPEARARTLQVACLGHSRPALTARLAETFLARGDPHGPAQAAALLLASPAFQWR